jgi:SpoVK/Ycf46/Vps4 family AAA+-type ATPase
MGPIRELRPNALKNIKAEDVRSIEEKDFQSSLKTIRPSVTKESLVRYKQWSASFGAS